MVELALRTGSPGALNSVIARAIDSCGLWGYATVDRQQPGTTYYIACGKDDIARVFDEISATWDRIEDKTLLLAATGEEPVVISPVTAAQVVAVIDAPDLASRLAWAKYYAEESPEQDATSTPATLPADDGSELRIPKPSLTSPDFDRAAMAKVERHDDQVNLKIVVIGID